MSAAIQSSNPIPPGLAIVQSNLPERLRELLLGHLRAHPLAPLEDEVVLVQSRGIGRWLQLGMAADPGADGLEGGLGISASVQFELPAVFQWRAYRTVLGADAVPEVAPFDAERLRWRLYRLLPALQDDPVFEPLARYLARTGDACRRRWQLAVQLADLFEQYQIYRADWLAAWEQGEDRVGNARGVDRPLDGRQAWQPALWRRVLDSLPEAERRLSRAHLHQAFVERLRQATARQETVSGLPRRIVVFGISSLPAQMVEAMAALAGHAQLLVCLHNPCRHYWGDIIEGRDLLRSRPGNRLNYRPDWPAQLDDQTIHDHANPLLAAWGRQGRDFFALLDHFDHPERYRAWFDRIDQFEDVAAESAPTLLGRIQQDILDLEPRVSDPGQRHCLDPASDLSLRFHAAHSRQREVEILHDQLLAALEKDETLKPRDIIVMVPDIDAYVPHIEAVFGAREADARRLPFHIADRRERLASTTLKAFTTLLDLPRLRLTASEVIDWIKVPAVGRRFGINESEVERIGVWLTQAGVRWGLDGEHRASLGLESGFSQFSWKFGMQRMLLGHASGEADAFAGILPFDEVAGSDADLAGRLAQLVERLQHYWKALGEARGMAGWADHLRGLIDDFFDTSGDEEALAGYQLDLAIDALVEAAAAAGLDQPLPLQVVRDALIEQLDQGHVSHRFLGGKVNFSTLMPMRAIPFQMVCLLGMNDGDYPRTRKPADFDLMGQPGLYRPGDRSRREDDRYLFLEALLAARKRLYISWVGRSIHNDEEQPPSVLVGQLRDYIAGSWQLAGGTGADPADADKALLDALTTWHPLQPFSRRYFEGHEQLFTYAGQWRRVHEPADSGARPARVPDLTPWPLDGPLTVAALEEFLRQPVAHFTRRRLGARLEVDQVSLADSEPFGLDGLERWALDDALLNELLRAGSSQHWPEALARAAERLSLAGRVPLGDAGGQVLQQARDRMVPVAKHWLAARERWPGRFVPGPVRLALTGLNGEPLVLEQWLPELQRDGDGACALLIASATRLTDDKGVSPQPRWDKLVRFWPRHLLLNAAGFAVHSVVAHQKGWFEWQPLPAEQARAALQALVCAWQTGLQRPLPVATESAIAYLKRVEKSGEAEALRSARDTYEGGWNSSGEAGREPDLARWYPDFDSLLAAGQPGDDFVHWAGALYGPAMAHHGDQSGEDA